MVRSDYGIAALIVATYWIVLWVTAGSVLGVLNHHAEMFALGLGLNLALQIAATWGPRSGRDAAMAGMNFSSPPSPARGEARVIAFAAAAVLVPWIPLLCERITLPPVAWDALTYHIRFPALWLQTGHLTTTFSPLGDSSHTYYPLVGEMLLYWGMLSTGTDLWSSASQVPFMIATAFAIVWLSMRSGASRGIAVLAALGWSGTPGLLRQSVEPMTDIQVAAFFVLAVFSSARYREGGERCWFFLLAASLGLLIGTKYTGLVYALAAAPIIAWSTGSGTRGREHVRLSSGTLLVGLGLVLLLGGLAYIRNAAAYGNPLLPLSLKIGGTTVIHGQHTTGYFYGGGTNRLGWRTLLLSPRMLLEMGPAFPLLLVALVVGFILSLRSRSAAASNRLPAWLAITAILGFVTAAGVLPFREHRYFFGITALAWCLAPALAAGTSRAGIWRRGVVILLAIQVPLTLFYWGKDLVVVGPSWSHALAAILLLTIGLGMAARFGMQTTLQASFEFWQNRARARYAVIATLAAVVGFGVVVGTVCYERGKFELWRKYWGNRHEWENLREARPDLRDMAESWAFLAGETRDKPTLIGYSGMNIPYPLGGYGLRNRVLFVPHTEDETASLFDWGMRVADPVTGGTEEDWLRNIQQLHVRYQCVYRMQAGGPAAEFPIERAWADGNPAIFTLIRATQYVR